MSRDVEYFNLIDVRRLEWDPTELPTTDTRIWSDIKTYEQHHSGVRGPRDLTFAKKASWLLAIERMHEMQKHWSDIFYHLFVFADGEVWEGRNILRTSQGNISDAVTVHIPGNNEVVTEAQHASLLRIAQWATPFTDRVRDHRQRPAATICSGDNGRQEINRLRAELDSIMADHTHVYQDLSGHPDAVAAVTNGIYNGSDPTGAASRSVAAVMSERALTKATTRAVDGLTSLARRIDELEARLAVLERPNEVLSQGQLEQALAYVVANVEVTVAQP